VNKLELILFNVGHGLSVALIEYPENYVTLIDLGSEEYFSPLIYLSDERKLRPDVLYITHPHGDHISDVDIAFDYRRRPDYICYQNYDWDDVKAREKESLRSKIDSFLNLVGEVPSGSYGGNGSLTAWSWSPVKAKETFEENTYINNSSYFIIYQWRDFKIAVGGDHHSDAMELLCENDKFKENAKNSDILIAPHHGHMEGYPALWTKNIGKPYISLISIQEEDPSIASPYQSENFAKGVVINGETRYTLTTRKDGIINVSMWYDAYNKSTWSFK
jgi:competence protein ComEC